MAFDPVAVLRMDRNGGPADLPQPTAFSWAMKPGEERSLAAGGHRIQFGLVSVQGGQARVSLRSDEYGRRGELPVALDGRSHDIALGYETPMGFSVTISPYSGSQANLAALSQPRSFDWMVASVPRPEELSATYEVRVGLDDGSGPMAPVSVSLRNGESRTVGSGDRAVTVGLSVRPGVFAVQPDDRPNLPAVVAVSLTSAGAQAKTQVVNLRPNGSIGAVAVNNYLDPRSVRGVYSGEPNPAALSPWRAMTVELNRLPQS